MARVGGGEVCRTCLGSGGGLRPIFCQRQRSERHSRVLLAATGQRIHLEDGLPQQICAPCRTTIKNIIRYQKRCKQTDQQLKQQLAQIRDTAQGDCETVTFSVDSDCESIIDTQQDDTSQFSLDMEQHDKHASDTEHDVDSHSIDDIQPKACQNIDNCQLITDVKEEKQYDSCHKIKHVTGDKINKNTIKTSKKLKDTITTEQILSFYSNSLKKPYVCKNSESQTVLDIKQENCSPVTDIKQPNCTTVTEIKQENHTPVIGIGNDHCYCPSVTNVKNDNCQSKMQMKQTVLQNNHNIHGSENTNNEVEVEKIANLIETYKVYEALEDVDTVEIYKAILEKSKITKVTEAEDTEGEDTEAKDIKEQTMTKYKPFIESTETKYKILKSNIKKTSKGNRDQIYNAILEKSKTIEHNEAEGIEAEKIQIPIPIQKTKYKILSSNITKTCKDPTYQTYFDKIGELRVYRCELCKKVYHSHAGVTRHIKGHFGGPDIMCQHCSYRCHTKTSLLMHCRSKHGYERKHKCSYCDYTGANAAQVKEHERRHTGERPYMCARCGDTFTRYSSYRHHIDNHRDRKLGKAPVKRVRKPCTYRCLLCPREYRSTCSVRDHVRRVHADHVLVAGVPCYRKLAPHTHTKVANRVEGDVC